MLAHFLWVFGLLLPQIWFGFAEIYTKYSILADKNSACKTIEKF